MILPQGFKAAGIIAGIKESGKPDLGLIASDYPLHWALMSTENALKAPCVQRNRSRFTSGQPVFGLVVNSGNANCATGDVGTWDNEDFAAAAATVMGLARVQDILTASTGVVGQRLPLATLKAAMPKLKEALTDSSKAFAEAIVTTDTHIKQVAINLRGGARIVGVAKGSGMIHPNMATMLAFIMTDAIFPQDALRELWSRIVNRSFNCVTVDGDTSPNDMAILLSSHQVRAEPKEFGQALLEVAQQLAQKIARDGEGATKLLTVNVTSARTDDDARKAARAVARSPLVKAAVHGADPNWGRILVAVGASAVISDMANLRIALQTREVFKGAPQPFAAQEISESMQVNDVVIDIDLAAGSCDATAWGCDLTADYVHINADYTT